MSCDVNWILQMSPPFYLSHYFLYTLYISVGYLLNLNLNANLITKVNGIKDKYYPLTYKENERNKCSKQKRRQKKKLWIYYCLCVHYGRSGGGVWKSVFLAGLAFNYKFILCVLILSHKAIFKNYSWPFWSSLKSRLKNFILDKNLWRVGEDLYLLNRRNSNVNQYFWLM